MAPAMAPSTQHIQKIISQIEDIISAYDSDCQHQQDQQEQQRKAENQKQALARERQQQQQDRPPLSTPRPEVLASGGGLGRSKRRRGIFGRLLRQCLPAGGTGGGGPGASPAGGGPKIRVSLGWASAVTFNWRRNAYGNGATNSSSGISKQKKGGGGRSAAAEEPVVLIGRRPRRSTVFMVRARRLRRSLPARLRRRLDDGGGGGGGDGGGSAHSEEEGGASGADFADLATSPDVVESSVMAVGEEADVTAIAAATGVQDSELPSAVLATPQRRALDDEVRRIEEEIETVRRQLDAPDTAPADSPPLQSQRRRLLQVTSSGLDPAQVAQLRRLCEAQSGRCAYQARFQFDLACHTTHVVIRESSVSRVSERTLKYFQALVSGAWLLSFDWVTDSLASGSLRPESDYEIQGDLSCGVNHMGPARSRRGRARCPGPSRLLEQFAVSVVGEFLNMPKFALHSLVQQCGGKFVPDPDLLPRHGPAGQLSVAVADQDDAGFSESRCRSLAASGGIVVLNRDWLLDSISKYRVQQLHLPEYCIAPLSAAVMEVLTRQQILVPGSDGFVSDVSDY